MQDISYRSVRPKSPVVSTSVSQPAPDTRPAAVALVRIIAFATSIGDWLVATFGGMKSRTIITKPTLTVHELVTPKGTHVLHHAGKKVTETATKVGKTVTLAGSVAGKKARTPLGKVTIVQTVALLALFAYVIHMTPTTKTTSLQPVAAHAVGETTVQTLHEFLPSAQDYVQPQAFQESVVKQTTSLTLNTWAAPWNLDTVAQNAASYSSISAFWLTLQSDGVSFQPKADWAQWQTFVSTYRSPGQKLYLTVTGDPNDVLTGILDPTNRAQQIANLLQIVQQQGFDGIDIDYEGLGSTNSGVFTSFIGDLSQAFHAQNKLVAVTVEAGITTDQIPMDWTALSSLADQIRVMAYDYHASVTGQPGPIAPLGWVKELLNYASATIPAGKLIVGLGNYGYDWQSPTAAGQSWQGNGISFAQATALAQTNNAPITRSSGIDANGYDIGSIPNFTYKDDQGNIHQVWFEDAASLQAKVNLVNQYPGAGTIFWSVGLGDADFWNQATTPTTNGSTN